MSFEIFRCRDRRAFLTVGLLLAGVLGALPVKDSALRASAPAADAVAATVNGKPILLADVQADLAAVLAGRQVEGPALAQLQAEMLEQLIDRRLVEERFARDKDLVAPPAVDDAIAKLRSEAAEHKTTLEELLAQRQSNLDILRRQLTWQLSWKQFVDKHLTEEAAKHYFDNHPEDFDGTERRVSHILLRQERAGDPEGTAKLIAQATKLREEIAAGKISFADAAKKYSAGPSRHEGGDLGFMPRHGLMDEAFSTAAFSVPKGEMAKPVVTRFGVHLIRVTDVKRGTKTFKEVQAEVAEPAARAAFQRMAAAERKAAKIAYTGLLPRVNLETRHLSPGGAAAK